MTAEEIKLVKKSFSQIKDINDFTNKFYKNLFDYDNTLKILFKRDIATQIEMLSKTLQYAVRNLDSFSDIESDLKELGKKHANYGVKPEHYNTVGNMLIKTLQEQLGDAFQENIRKAWLNAYKNIANTMMSS